MPADPKLIIPFAVYQQWTQTNSTAIENSTQYQQLVKEKTDLQTKFDNSLKSDRNDLTWLNDIANILNTIP